MFYSKKYGKNVKEIVNFKTDATGTRCTNNRCLICPKIRFSNCIVSSVTNYKMGTVKDNIANCKSKYVIYAITCKTCNIQYVGETQAMLRDRMHQHRSSMRNEERNTYLCNHFNEPEHDSENFYIDILDNIENDDKRTRLNKELFWIKLLMTPYPFGLNDQVIGYGNISSEILPFDKSSHPYYGFKIIRFKQKRSKRKKRHNLIHGGNQIDISAIIDSISKQRTHQLHCTLKNFSSRKINN